MRGKRIGVRAIGLLLAIFLLAGCGDDEPEASTPAPLVESGSVTPIIPTATPTAQPPTDTPAPTAQPTRVVIQEILPAALYFLQDGQIQRLESDGVTLTQMTQEQEPISDFDVSPVDARLIYVAGNSLIEANPQYGIRFVKVVGEPESTQPFQYMAQRISDPHFSPDGSQIAFGLNGINLIPAGEATESSLVLPSDPYPDPNNPPRSQVRFFSPGSWSPDGTKLLVNFAYWPEAGGIAIFDLTTAELIEIVADDPNAAVCCQWQWGADSAVGHIASDLLAYGVPGLTRVDVATGQAVPLVIGMPPTGPGPENPIRLFQSAFAQNDGTVLSFVSSSQNFDQDAPAILFTVSPDGTLIERTGVGTIPSLLGVLWAVDGSGAVIQTADDAAPGEGHLHWLSLNGETWPLPISGQTLRWAPGMDASRQQQAAAAELAVTPASDDATTTAGESTSPGEDAPQLVARAALNLRSGPGTLYPVVGSLASEESVAIVGVSPDRTWWQVVAPAQNEATAWVIGDPAFVETKNADDVAVVTPPPPPAPVGRIFFPGRDLDGQTAILVQGVAAGSAPEILLSNASQPNLSPDGSKLAVRSVRSDLLGIGIWDLTAKQISGLTSHQEDTLPGWNPTGDAVVFASTRHGDRRWRVYVQPAIPNEPVREIAFGLDPDWHPAADIIAFKGCDVSGENCGIWTMDSLGGQQRPVTNNKSDSRPVWSPTGRTIVFMSEARDGNWEIYRTDADGNAVTRLTNNPANDGLPVVSPDGRQIAFVSNRGGEWSIWVMPIVGGSPERLLRLGADLPNWLEQSIDWTR